MSPQSIRLRLPQVFRPAKPWCALAPRFEAFVRELGVPKREDAVRLIVAEKYFSLAPHAVGVAATSGTVYLGMGIAEVGLGPLGSLIANLMNHGEIGLSEYCYGIENRDVALDDTDRALLHALGKLPKRIFLGEDTQLEFASEKGRANTPRGRDRLLKHYIGKGADVFDVICKKLIDHAYVSSQLAYNDGGGCALRLSTGEIV
ncbi:hypothetical protein FOZ63_009727, partial [Perkinsus olseni]